MMQKHIAPILLGLLLFVCITGLALESNRAQQAETALEEIYQSALMETTEQMQALSLALEKVLVSGDAAQCTRLLSQISQLSDDVRRNLTFLPLSHEAMVPTLVFANQLAEYAGTLLPVLVEQGALPTQDAAQLETLLTDCTQLGTQLALAQQSLQEQRLALYTGEQVFTAVSASDSRPLEALGDQDHGMQYPTLIYDGAFSDARHLGAPKGLPEGTVTQDEAVAIARAFVGEERVISARNAPATSGALPAWGVTVVTQDLQLNLEITTQGGKVLWMMPESAGFTPALEEARCRELAAAFLREKGFGEMVCTHAQRYESGIMVLNFAAEQDGVLLYPDLVKVQLRLDTGDVVGLEANNYWMNHVERELDPPALTAQEAAALLAPGLDTQSNRLCVIPYRDGEQLCYEFTVCKGDGTYLIYLDADTGKEVELLKRIDTEQGVLTAKISRKGEKIVTDG